jgi:hypothetical protein
MPAGKVDFDNIWRTHVERSTPIRWRTLEHRLTKEKVTIYGWCGHPPVDGPWVGWTLDLLPADKSLKAAPMYRWEFWKQVMVGLAPVVGRESLGDNAQCQWLREYPQSREDSPSGPFRKITMPNHDELVLTLTPEKPKRHRKKIK